MGAAVWLYGWLVLRQTRQEGATGWVLGGKPIGYREINEETGFEPRTLERWMRVLRKGGYIETRTAPGGVIVQITKAKKFTRANAEGVRKIAEGVRENAYPGTQVCGAKATQAIHSPDFSVGISSGYVEREEKDKSSGLGEARTEKSQAVAEALQTARQFPNGREASRLLKNLKQEIVRRELRAGEGPRVSPAASAGDAQSHEASDLQLRTEDSDAMNPDVGEQP
jgi:DNA-binding transcriptional ArsR family regulator